MATLSQHYDRNLDVNPYYVPINKQPSPMYDKSKKTWSQRLKITKSEKATNAQMVVPQLPIPQLQPPQLQLNEYTGNLEFTSSALSRSMKYAEPWIYGTVRGIPARPLHFHPGQAIFAPMPSEIAVVICSCPEYLNGTKREVKKASICKKCKGSRLPLAPIGGTVRIRPTSTPIQQKIRPTNAATLRVVSSKSRPSILDPTRDPYDLMRRTRLLSPEPKSVPQQSEKSYRPNRGKSASPCRSRSRTPRSQLEDLPKQSPKGSKTDPWIVDDASKEPNHRRSILRCNVNPYDLISNKSSTPTSSSSAQHHLSEFSPNHHDQDDDDADVTSDVFSVPASRTINQKTPITRKTPEPRTPPTPSPSPSSQLTLAGSSVSATSSATKTVNYSNVKAIAGQRISFGENKTSSSLITQNGDSFMYENVTPEPLDNDSSPKHSAKKDEVAPPNQPKRPPRRKNDTNPAHDTVGGEDSDNGVVTVTLSNEQHQSSHHHYQNHQMSSQISPDSTPTVVASQRPSIKSILKRPLSAPPSTVVSLATTTMTTTPSPKSSLNGDTDTGSLVGSNGNPTDPKQQQQQHHHHHHQIKRNSGRTTHENPAKSSSTGTTSSNINTNANTIVVTKSSNDTSTGSNSGSGGGGGSGGGNNPDTMLVKSNGGQKTGAPEAKTGSQFYIPLPQARKKVQFMVEDKIIQVDNACYRDDDDDDNDECREHEHEYENTNKNKNDIGENKQDDEEDEDEDEDDDDEDDYHSAQEDDDTSDRSQIPKQMCKASMNSRSGSSNTNSNDCYQNCFVAARSGSGVMAKNENTDVTHLEQHSTSTIAVGLANRSSDYHHQHQQQQQHQRLLLQQQEAVLNLHQPDSNLVSSELLNSTKTSSAGHYQNLPLHPYPHHHNQQQPKQQQSDCPREDEPHYEDVPDDTSPTPTIVNDVVPATIEDDAHGGTGAARTKDCSSGDLKTATTTKGKITSQESSPGTQATAIVVPGTTSSSALSRKAIRRTNSERHSCNSSIDTSSTNVIVNFKDTMALRIKANRKDSRDIFSNSGSTTSMQQSVGLFRPRDPPPPPPTASQNHQQQQRRLSTTRTNVTTKETTQAPAGSNKTQTILITGTKDDDNENNHDYDTVDDDDADDGNAEDDADNNEHNRHHQQRHHPQHRQGLSLRNRNLSANRGGLDEQKQSPTGRTSTAADRSGHDRITSNIYETFDSLSPTLAESAPLPPQPSNKYTFGNPAQPNRTVVRVAPFNKTSSEIHRLKISHTDDDTKASGARNSANNANNQKKTSILINGDDCYSTVNVTNDTPLYQSSVVVADSSSVDPMLKVASNTVTINVVSSSPRTPEEELIYKNNKINTLLSRGATRAIIPITGCGNPINIGSSVSSPEPVKTSPKRGRTLITLDYDKSPSPLSSCSNSSSTQPSSPGGESATNDEIFSHEEELVKVLRNPVEAVRRNLVPHVCGKAETTNLHLGQVISIDNDNKSSKRVRKRHKNNNELTVPPPATGGTNERSISFVGKLLEDPTLSQLAEGLENDVVVKLIENSLKRLKESRNNLDTTGTKDNDDMNRLINMSLQRIKDERQKLETNNQKPLQAHDADDQHEIQSNRGSISSGNSFSSANYEMFDFSDNNESDCYQSCSSELAIDVDAPQETRSKFYQMLVDATLAEIEISTNADDDHHYESIRGIGSNNINGDPIYEEITDIPPPLPLSPPPLNDPELEKKAARSMFEGASKYDILSYLVDAKERGLVREESFEYNINNTSNPIIIEEENDTLSDLKQISDLSSRISHLSVTSDSSEDNASLTGSTTNDRLSVLSALRKGTASEIERNDSGVGSETSKSSRSKYQNSPQTGSVLSKISPIHLCEDCDGPVETQVTDSGVMFAPLVCRKCGKKRAERKEIITEIVETEEKYGRDLQIILEEFCQPMLVAGLLTQEQLSAIFLNTEELLENNQTLAERMRDALDIALEQGDDDLLTVNIGKIFLDFTQMLHAFESYCVRQAGASLLLANLEKEKELLRIFLKVSQMENTVLRRMNLNSFLMVPVQRVTKYPLLLARLYKVTPPHLDGRDLLKQAQEKIELHLNHINQEAKDVPTKLWRRISSSSPNRRASCEIDMINIKLRKMAIDILEWNHDEVRFAMEGRLLYTQPTDSNWKKGRTIKLNPVNALLVTNGKPTANYKAEKSASDQLNFPKHTGIREASLLVVKEKCGRYTLIREPLYLDRCIVCTEADWDDYFELQEISSKETFIFKAEDGVRTKQWYTQLQYHAQGMGAWRKRRNALANIMINGMLSRT